MLVRKHLKIKNWRTAILISVKLVQYAFYLNTFHLLKTGSVDQTKSKKGRKEGRLSVPSRNALLYKEPVSQYRCMNVPMIKIEHMKMMQMAILNIKVNASFWASPLQDQFKSIVFEWAIPQNRTRGWGRGGRLVDTYLKKHAIFLVFLCIHGNFKQNKHPHWKFGKIMYVKSVRNFKAKKPRPLEISHEFHLVFLENSTFFSN